MKLACLTVILILLPRLANAEPLYLNCKIEMGSEIKNISVKIEEDTNKITHTHSHGSDFNADGFFTNNKISYQKITNWEGIRITELYTINRLDLSIQYDFAATPIIYSEHVAGVYEKYSGNCQVESVDKDGKK